MQSNVIVKTEVSGINESKSDIYASVVSAAAIQLFLVSFLPQQLSAVPTACIYPFNNVRHDTCLNNCLVERRLASVIIAVATNPSI